MKKYELKTEKATTGDRVHVYNIKKGTRLYDYVVNLRARYNIEQIQMILADACEGEPIAKELLVRTTSLKK